MLNTIYNGYGSIIFASILTAFAGIGVGNFTTSDEDKIDNLLPKAIEIHNIQIFSDNTSLYERTVHSDNVLMVWTGQIFNIDGSVHCSGGEPHQYEKSEHQLLTKTVDWLVGDDCSGLEPGMKFFFTWTPLHREHREAHYPLSGLGVVEKPPIPALQLND